MQTTNGMKIKRTQQQQRQQLNGNLYFVAVVDEGEYFALSSFNSSFSCVSAAPFASFAFRVYFSAHFWEPSLCMCLDVTHWYLCALRVLSRHSTAYTFTLTHPTAEAQTTHTHARARDTHQLNLVERSPIENSQSICTGILTQDEMGKKKKMEVVLQQHSLLRIFHLRFRTQNELRFQAETRRLPFTVQRYESRRNLH